MTLPPRSTLTLLPSKGDLVVWGDDSYDQINKKPPGAFVKVARGGAHQSLAIHTDGSLAFWGTDPKGITVTPPAGQFTDAALGITAGIAIRSDGVVVPWGTFANGGPVTPPAALTSQIATSVALGGAFALAIANYTIFQWGVGGGTQPPGNGFREVAARNDYCVALRVGGVPSEPPAPPELRGGGALVGWGGTMFPQTGIPAKYGPSHLPGWSVDANGYHVHPGPFIAVAAGNVQRQLNPPRPHVLALTADHRVVGWGADTWGEISKAPKGVRFSEIAAGHGFSLGIDEDGYLHYWGNPLGVTLSAGPAVIPAGGTPVGGPSVLSSVPKGRFLSIGAGNDHVTAIADYNPPPARLPDR